MNTRQQQFVTEYLRIGDKMIAYKKAYDCDSSSYRTVESAANRLLQHPEVAAAIAEVTNRIRHEVEQQLQQELKTQLLTVQRKRELLARIAEGDIYVEQNYKGKDCNTCTQLVKPTVNQMLKAIDLDSKLAGHYTNDRNINVVHTTQVTPQPAPQDQEVVAAPDKALPASIVHTRLHDVLFHTTLPQLHPAFARKDELVE